MNQQDDREDDKQTNSLADLPLTGEQAEETKAGAATQSNKLVSFKASDPNTL